MDSLKRKGVSIYSTQIGDQIISLHRIDPPKGSKEAPEYLLYVRYDLNRQSREIALGRYKTPDNRLSLASAVHLTWVVSRAKRAQENDSIATILKFDGQLRDIKSRKKGRMQKSDTLNSQEISEAFGISEKRVKSILIAAYSTGMDKKPPKPPRSRIFRRRRR